MRSAADMLDVGCPDPALVLDRMESTRSCAASCPTKVVSMCRSARSLNGILLRVDVLGRHQGTVSGGADRGHFDLHPDIGPDQRRGHREHEHGLVGDDRRSHGGVGGDVGGVGQPLPHADDVAERGADSTECVFNVSPGLGDLLAEVLGQGAVGPQPLVPEVWMVSTPAGMRTASA